MSFVNSAKLAWSSWLRAFVFDARIFSVGMSRIGEATGGTAFVPLATIVAFICFSLPFF